MNLAKQIIADQLQICEFPKKRRRCQESCGEHLFALSALQKTKNNLQTEVNFCPRIPRGSQPHESTHPQYNLDKLHYTSAFVLGIDRRTSQQTRIEQYAEHHRIMKITNQKNCKVHFPKPNSKHTICSVCKVNYGTHYYAHILGEKHKETIRRSVYNQYILELTGNFKQLHPDNDAELSTPFQFPDYMVRRLQEEAEIRGGEIVASKDIASDIPSQEANWVVSFDRRPRPGRRGKKSTKKQNLLFENENVQKSVERRTETEHTKDQGYKLEQVRVSGQRGRPPKKYFNLKKIENLPSNEMQQMVEQGQKLVIDRNNPYELLPHKEYNDLLSSNAEEIEEHSSSSHSEIEEQRIDEEGELGDELGQQFLDFKWIQLELDSEELKQAQQEQVRLENIAGDGRVTQFSSPHEESHKSLYCEREDCPKEPKKQVQIIQNQDIKSEGGSTSKKQEKKTSSLKDLIKRRIIQKFRLNESKEPASIVQVVQIPHNNEQIAKSTVGSQTNMSLQGLQKEKSGSLLSDSLSEEKEDAQSEEKGWKDCFSKYIKNEDRSSNPEPIKVSQKRVMKFDNEGDFPLKKIILNDKTAMKKRVNPLIGVGIAPNTPIICIQSDSDDSVEAIDWKNQVKKVSQKPLSLRPFRYLMNKEDLLRLSQHLKSS